MEKAPVVIKSKSGEEKKIQKMKIVKQTKSKNHFEKQFHDKIVKFRGHTDWIKRQFTAQRILKEPLEQIRVYIHMDFVKDCWCCSQEEIQSAYWSQT